MSNSKKRNITIDIAKGIGIIGVLIGHSLGRNSNLKLMIYQFHMPLFFVLSGLVMNDQPDKIQKSKIIKIDRKVIYYLLYSCVYIAYDLMFRIDEGSIKSILFWDVYKTISLFGINVLWFLTTLYGAQLTVNFLMSKIGKKKMILCTFVTLVVSIIVSPYVNILRSINKGGILYYPLCNIIRSVSMAAFVAVGIKFKEFIKVIEGFGKKNYLLSVVFITPNVLAWGGGKTS